jgi:hypothetical protein
MYSFLITGHTKYGNIYDILLINSYHTVYINHIYDIKEDIIKFEKIIFYNNKEIYRKIYTFEELCKKFNIY